MVRPEGPAHAYSPGHHKPRAWPPARAGVHTTLTWGPPQSSTTDSDIRVPLGAQEEEGALAFLCPPGHPCRSAASAGLPGENPICLDTQHQWPRPRQALGDKGPLLSSAGPGTRIGSAQQPQTAGHPRSRAVRRKEEVRKTGLSPSPTPNFSLLFPLPCSIFLLHKPFFLHRILELEAL